MTEQADYYEVMNSPEILEKALDIPSLQYTIQVLATMYKTGCSFYDYAEEERPIPLHDIVVGVYESLVPTENLKLNELRIITLICSVNIDNLLRKPLTVLANMPLTQMCVNAKILKELFKVYKFPYDRGTVSRTIHKLAAMKIIVVNGAMIGFSDNIYINLKHLVQNNPEHFVAPVIEQARITMAELHDTPDDLKEFVSFLPKCLYKTLDI